MRRWLRRAPVLAAVATAWGQTSPGPAPAPAGQPADVYELGKELFDQLAPPEVKEQYEFPSRQDVEEFMQRLEKTIENGDLQELAGYEPEARAALAVLATFPDYADYANWLAARIEEMDAARQIAAYEREAGRPSPPRTPARANPRTAPAPAGGPYGAEVPYYGFWLRRLEGKPPPAAAARLIPLLRSAFASEGAPADLAWLAEVESSLDPSARSPAGAKGLYQLTPATAKELGLSTFLPDERTDPEKSARAAARLLRKLHADLGSWPLALAAYNAGEGRVDRALKGASAADFGAIDRKLPAETRMYVPEVGALVKVRSGTDLFK